MHINSIVLNDEKKYIDLKYIINKLAEVRQRSYKEVEEITNRNAKKLFKKMN